MKIQYFQDTDTLYIEFKSAEAAETEHLDENALLDVSLHFLGADHYARRKT